MKKLFELPELLTIHGTNVSGDPTDDDDDYPSACEFGCDIGCAPGSCLPGSWI